MSITKFTPEHEWLRLEGDVITIGITHFAQDQLGDVVFVQLPEVGQNYAVGDEVAVIESVKTAGGIAMPFAGVVTEINDALNDKPELVNEDALGAGWFFKIAKNDATQLDILMDEAAYNEFIATLS